ncbi:hypothetical protein FRACYDRAFT_236576 [Fragilariopsis cylindrus CCMP1102]|uniref:Uncharacterized protein n=1 Tax=Fragilariopsis cylindrus CCMP1102 TaxID=635003 RepID=A0A1E7FJG8_9STRA|nr:hypothetical protein FRACYDRAFT_236576 [Fragilariopsis cylindrus CCMP1102]|eukprot:OEU18298.1 hypothetical protein FRACYDRAFT_236576 [Fragilariopsis cylindrus CCMP1102]
MNDFANIRVWEGADATSNNPILIIEDDNDVDNNNIYHQTEEKKKSSSSSKKKKRRRRKKKVSEEESSIADSMLSSILSESELSSDDDSNMNNHGAGYGDNSRLTTLSEETTTNNDYYHNNNINNDFYGNRNTSNNNYNVSPSSFSPSKMMSKQQERFPRLAEKNRHIAATPTILPAAASGNKIVDTADDDGSRNPFGSNDNDYSSSDNEQYEQRNPFKETAKNSALNPFDDNNDDSDASSAVIPPPRSTYRNEEVAAVAAANQKEVVVDDADDDGSKNPFSSGCVSGKQQQREAVVDDADDDGSKNPFSGGGGSGNQQQREAAVSANTNPFAEANDDIEEHDEVDTDEDEMRTVVSEDCIETTLQEDRGVVEIRSLVKSRSDVEEEENEEDEEEEEEEEEEDDEEDIIESSKRLLRCVDQRMQYQQKKDGVQSLKATIQQMKTQAEAMAEQLRRAVETKCDLVLAQNEMERRHEQDQIAKEGEVKDLRMYIQEILETQAKSELNFMNEISSLANKLDGNQRKHKKLTQERDNEISKLESKIDSMKVGSVRDNSSRRAFRNRFSDGGSTSSSVGGCSYSSGRSGRSRSRNIHPAE